MRIVNVKLRTMGAGECDSNRMDQMLFNMDDFVEYADEATMSLGALSVFFELAADMYVKVQLRHFCKRK